MISINQINKKGFSIKKKSRCSSHFSKEKQTAYVTVHFFLPCLVNLIIRHQYRGLRDHQGQDLGTDFRQQELRPGSVRP